MRALGIALLFLAIGCTKKDEAPVDTGAAMAPAPPAMDTGVNMETGGMPPITDTSRIPSDDSLPIKKR